MRRTDIIIQNLKRRKVRSILYIIGVMLSLLLVLSMNFLTIRYLQITEGFYRPFAGYDQIILKGSNYFQIIPVNSRINESLESDIEEAFGENAIPVLFYNNVSDVGVIDHNFIMGMPLDDIPELWGDFGLYSGRWPRNSSEVVVGYNLRDEDSVLIRNQRVDICGVLRSDKFYSPLADVVVVDLHTLQSITDNPGKVSLFFIDSSIEENGAENIAGNADNEHSDLIESFEKMHPELDVITRNEFGYVQQALANSLEQGGAIVNIISSISSVLFILTMASLKVYSKKKEISLLKMLGASDWFIFSLFWGEYMLILLIGIVLGTPISILLYLLFFSISESSLDSNQQSFSAVFGENVMVFFHTMGFWDVMGPILIIIGVGSLLSLIPAAISLRIKPLEHLNEKI